MNNSSAISLPAMENGIPPIKPIRFICICVLSFVLIAWLPESYFAPLNRATTHFAGMCLALFGNDPATTGDMILLKGFQVRIITECTALNSIILFGAFIFSAPASLKARMVGLAAGAVFLSCANTLRIAMVTMIGANCPALFEPAHVYLAQVVMIILVVASSILWLRMVTYSEGTGVPFPLRAFAMASIIFLPWLVLNRAYARFLDFFVLEIFALTNFRLTISYEHFIYFQTFNTGMFWALLFAERRLPLSRKAAWGVAGGVILAAGHLLFRIGNVLLSAFAWQPAFQMTAMLTICGEYLLPILLWLTASGRWRQAPQGFE